MGHRGLVVMAFGCFVACGDGAPAPGGTVDGSALAPDAVPTRDSTAGVPDAAAGDRDAGMRCQGFAAQPTDQVWSVAVDDQERSFSVHVPVDHEPTRPAALVFNFHGIGSNGTQQALWSGMLDKADAAGFVVVHPEGVGVQQSWNAGSCCGVASATGVDDVAFVAAMIDAISAQVCIDPARVYATGMSNGGCLAHRLACELSDRIAAVVPVAGVQVAPSCTPARAVSVLQFHGTADTIVPYDGSSMLGFPAVVDMMNGWAQRNGCGAQPGASYANGDVSCQTWPDCAAGAEVTLCTVDGGGHTWPGGLAIPALGYTTDDISATDAAWEFFTRHPLP